VRVVDGDGAARYPATAIACPYLNGTSNDCTKAITQEVGPSGSAVLNLDRDVRYNVFAFVTSPSPQWPCPGYRLGDDMLYLSPDSVDGLAQQLPSMSVFTIAEPTPYDCVTVTVIDDAGNPLEGAGLFVNDGFSHGTNAAGQVNLDVEPGTTYDLGTFITNTGWPCPWVHPDNGTEFHFGERRLVSAEELLDGETFVITKPEPSDCPTPLPTAEIRIVDGSGVLVPNAFVSVCQYDPATPPTYPNGDVNVCAPGTPWRGPDTDGVIRIGVDPDLMYDITGFLSCTNGWYLFGGGNFEQSGYLVWRQSGADLLANGLEMALIGDVETCLAPVPLAVSPS
jgi:hypothetical protein